MGACKIADNKGDFMSDPSDEEFAAAQPKVPARNPCKSESHGFCLYTAETCGCSCHATHKGERDD